MSNSDETQSNLLFSNTRINLTETYNKSWICGNFEINFTNSSLYYLFDNSQISSDSMINITNSITISDFEIICLGYFNFLFTNTWSLMENILFFRDRYKRKHIYQ